MSNLILEKVSYKINKDNIIVDIFDDWIRAAVTGKASNLADLNNVIGKNILSYFHNDTTQMYYNTVFQKCRLLQQKHSLEYRCDSPTHKRYMKMELVPFANKDINILNYLLKEEPFSYPIYIHESTKNNKTLYNIRCSICNNIKLKGENQWIKPDALTKVEEQSLFVIHSVCPDCQKKEWRIEAK
ncbi:MAG: hypothetical protein JXR68_14460 [Bacteroidales bacterium]|nr:hypothetical protein [Bacteroidales bacterium]